ncbi:MAG: SMP-30/gluconolactonase/LRE family protein [Gemmatimonadota bacterium]|nr:SMP-30/gluconolactonase/LRE family protein [Gemmatimonadota bacterium]
MPLGIAASPDGRFAAVLLSGWREQGVQLVDLASHRVVQMLPQPAAFLGIAWSPDGSTLYASGGDRDVVYRYQWSGGHASLRDSIVLAPRLPKGSGRSYPAGLAISPDGKTLYVAENLFDSLAVVELASGRVISRFGTERYPYGVAVAPDGRVYVSTWGGHTISDFAPGSGGSLVPAGRIEAGRHPSALALSADGSHLYAALATSDRISIIDTRARRLIGSIGDAPPGAREGSTPNALALSADGTRLFVAEADNNAVAIFSLPQVGPADSASARLLGRVPVDWYPTALLARGDSLVVVTGKGRGTAPNPAQPQPGARNPPGSHNYTLGQTSGTLAVLPASPSATTLDSWSRRVAHANGWDRSPPAAAAYPPLEHIVYIIKENRTYDQVFGDLSGADGDPSLLFFPRAVAPNHHALAERFGIFDRFFVNAEVSADGHPWSTGAYAADYVEKTVPSNYSSRGRTYDYEGENRDSVPAEGEDVNEPSAGYLWDLAQRAGISYRNYGEFVRETPGDTLAGRHYRGVTRALLEHSHPDFPPFDLDIPDQHRADLWIAELGRFARDVGGAGGMPALEIVHLPNDHTSGGTAGKPTPRAYMADNDLALGRMIEALSRSPFWKSSVVFVLEDDSQNGPDHVDSHRSPLLVISPYARGGVLHRFANTTDVIATIAEILHLGSLSQFDLYGRPLRDAFTSTPTLTPYTALTPAVSLSERNPRRSARRDPDGVLDLSAADRVEDDRFNRILWRVVKGDSVPYPGPSRLSAAEWMRRR